MNWEALKNFAESAGLVLFVATLIFSFFRQKNHRQNRKPRHTVISEGLLYFLAVINFSAVFALAWNGNSSWNRIILICSIAFCANIYATWNQAQMFWKGSLILSGLFLISAFSSIFEEYTAVKFAFWFNRGTAICLSAFLGGILARTFKTSLSS